jgi:hypothetical protein
MKAKILKTLATIALVISVLKILNSCGNREETTSCFPNQLISVQINISLPAYYPLQNIGGWVYISEQQSGTRGLIIYRASATSFKIYDRNAPHICPDTNTTLEVEGGTLVICKKDNAKWFLMNGAPAEVSAYPLKQYFSTFNPSTNVLNIYN